ncbi:response regulator transcription factor [Acetobacter farinalis]|uniref:Response regulator transcription factor n=1 Tax=Acetobacter farinalis TaxID=1260984 RepID=A0ABT3QAF3_9PROT|nr:response regulator transcription factor [Acetobacter farinalis]MCX2562262.1 response regulator transcription factor [Acetobacter farinalis]NHO30875.1 response regulator [Acetobacter farinalis]
MTNMTHLLIVDDDEEILSLLTRFFKTYGHEVGVANSGRDMFALLETAPINLVILDLMMPGENGLELCAEVRRKSQVPIIMLTAVDSPTDRIVGLELGADDYITKPFDQRELLARVKAVMRRMEPLRQPASQTRPLLLFGFWRLDIARRELRTTGNILVPLSGREFDLLLAFAERPQEVMSRDQLLDLAHGERHDAFDRSIDTQVSRLRRKLEPDAKDPTIIKTVRSGGYIFTLDVRSG